MKYRVWITSAAERDLEEIYDWIRDHDATAKADYVMDRLIRAAESIAALPNRGSRPRELPPGMHADYRQVFFKPYRVIYEVVGLTFSSTLSSTAGEIYNRCYCGGSRQDEPAGTQHLSLSNLDANHARSLPNFGILARHGAGRTEADSCRIFLAARESQDHHGLAT